MHKHQEVFLLCPNDQQNVFPEWAKHKSTTWFIFVAFLVFKDLLISFESTEIFICTQFKQIKNPTWYNV